MKGLLHVATITKELHRVNRARAVLEQMRANRASLISSLPGSELRRMQEGVRLVSSTCDLINEAITRRDRLLRMSELPRPAWSSFSPGPSMFERVGQTWQPADLGSTDAPTPNGTSERECDLVRSWVGVFALALVDVAHDAARAEIVSRVFVAFFVFKVDGNRVESVEDVMLTLGSALTAAEFAGRVFDER